MPKMRSTAPAISEHALTDAAETAPVLVNLPQNLSWIFLWEKKQKLKFSDGEIEILVDEQW